MATKDTIRQLMEEREQISKKINNSLKRELLKSENLTGSPLRLKEIVNLFGADYKVYSKKIKNLFESEVELQFNLVEEYRYKGFSSQIRCTMFRGLDLGLIKPISTSVISDVKVI